MAAKLYVVVGSHPCMTAAKALELKGVEYKRVEMPELVHMPIQRRRFGAVTVPGVQFDDGEKVQGSVATLHRLDERVPEPPLYPADPEHRRKVEELERWGDEELQGVARRLALWGLAHNPRAMPSYTVDSRFKMPAPLTRAFGPFVMRGAARVHRATDDAVRADIEAMPKHVERVDRAIEEGALGAEQPNAADLQLAPSLRLLLTYEDVRPMLEGHPAADLALRLFPEIPGTLPAGSLPVAA